MEGGGGDPRESNGLEGRCVYIVVKGVLEFTIAAPVEIVEIDRDRYQNVHS